MATHNKLLHSKKIQYMKSHLYERCLQDTTPPIATLKTTDIVFEKLLVNGIAGNKTLKFLEVGGEYGWATFIDEVSVHYYVPENLENCTQATVPKTQLTKIKQLITP